MLVTADGLFGDQLELVFKQIVEALISLHDGLGGFFSAQSNGHKTQITAFGVVVTGGKGGTDQTGALGSVDQTIDTFISFL